MSSLQDHQQQSKSSGGQGIEISKTRARQGVTGHNVRYILGIGLVSVIIAFAIIYIAFFAA